jgi:hypothetical protein
MQNTSRNTLVLLLGSMFVLAIIFTTGCKKKNDQDFRDSFTGNYLFSVKTYKTTTQDSTYLYSTWNYSGSITIGKNSNDIYIQYFSSLELFAFLSENGHVSNYPHLDGFFEGTNRIKFVVHWPGTDGISIDSVTGTRN